MNEGGWEENITAFNMLKLHYPKKKGGGRIYTEMVTVVF